MSEILALIGTAGRGTDASLLTLSKWTEMKRLIYRFVKDHGFTHVISGSAPYADHLSVGLFNADLIDSLTLALPCTFSWENARFVDGHEPFRPGTRLNSLHAQFSEMIGKSSLQEIKTAIYKGAEVVQRNGFHARNEVVAERATHMIAFTFGARNIVANGGTAHTCRSYLAKGKTALWHVDLNTMELHENGVVS